MSKPKNMTPDQEREWKDKWNEYQRKRYASNPGKTLIAQKKYREENPDKIKIKQSLHYLKNRERILERTSKYAKQNRGKKREDLKRSRRLRNQQSAADSFFQLQAAAHQISTALETKTKPNQ